MRFHTTILQGGKTATGIHVPDEVVEALGVGKRPKVSVTIRGYTYRSSIAVMDGVSMVGVSAENRAGAGVAGGPLVLRRARPVTSVVGAWRSWPSRSAC